MIQLTVSKSNVFNEVAKTTAYVGKKMPGEENVYERISTTDADREMLERFWNEAAATASAALRHDLANTGTLPVEHGVDLSRDYSIALGLAVGFNDALVDTMQATLYSYFVNSILSKWFMIANKEEAASYATAAAGMLDDVVRMTYQRRRPTRI